MSAIPDLAALVAAHERIRAHVHRTPVMTSRYLDGRSGARVFLKAENLQRVGAFKARGACNAVLSLDAQAAARGVVTHSSGNHAQALAYAAGLRGIPAYIVMPADAPPAKRAAVEEYGGLVTECEPTLEARERTTAAVQARTGATLVHPYDDPAVIAGQGTAALELLEDVPGLDLLVVPVGGGGLAAGSCIAAAGHTPPVAVVGVEPAAADDARRSLAAGRILPSEDPVTIADGLRTALGEMNFEILRQGLSGIVTVDECAIASTMRRLWERTKLIVEPSGAVPVAALLTGALDVAGKRVGVILSGGNVNLDRLPW